MLASGYQYDAGVTTASSSTRVTLVAIAEIIPGTGNSTEKEVTENPIIWQPSRERCEGTAMYRFMREQGHNSYSDLYAWSLQDREEFWQALIRFCDVRFSKEADSVLTQSGDMTTATWYSGGQLNFAEHLLRHSGERAAIIFCGENGARRELSFDELRAEVARAAAGMRAAGVTTGDCVGGFLPNCPEAIVAMLAATSMGAIWSSCSPDFGINGVVDRFGQIAPKVLVCADGYFYAGKHFDSLELVRGVLKSIPSIMQTVVVPFSGDLPSLAKTANAVSWADFTSVDEPLQFDSLPFDHPLYVMYSSGTTGAPKCIVHGSGGTLLQHLKEHVLHCDISVDDRLFYFTTCGWMMWNWLASGLATGATLMLFDGSPFHDDGRILWRMAEKEKVTVFGASAKYIAAQEKAGIRPRNEFDLSSLRCVLSTGSPLAPASFDYVYRDIAADVQLSSVSGGTDILGCFASGNPLLPVRRGELQCLALAMAVAIYDDDGNAVINQNGELVCTEAFPSMPVCFWNDPGDIKYHAAYFEKFPGVWAHGDYAELTDENAMIIHGRSDAVLNPGGVRIGTSEIYRQVEKLDEIVESIAIGQNWDDDVRVVLFVILRDGVALTDDLCAKIRQMIRSNTTPRHVPAKIVQVAEIPRTISGKIVELAVRSAVHGHPVKNTDALANPEALQYFRDLPELATD